MEDLSKLNKRQLATHFAGAIAAPLIITIAIYGLISIASMFPSKSRDPYDPVGFERQCRGSVVRNDRLEFESAGCPEWIWTEAR